MATSLESGVSVSRYSIVGPIGAGGMGEVYKAQDPSLDRMVAIKILPPDLVRNDERRRRFVQEARSASSLNHPHIVTIHEIGETTVAETGEPLHYIAMELIDGSTLKRKIHYEQTDLRTVLSWMAQAADGLAKAHGAGIVHRDLKPENIMVTRDGFAKVLDFGLAKLSVRKSAADAGDTTIAREETREGAVMGTVAYMSPEQVVGKVVDHRSDIFSFGAILYEAATHRRPFAADSDVDVMHKILHEKPQPIDEIDPTVPPEVRRVIRRCLAKDPERRYQSMKDLAIELREIVEEYEDLSAATRSRVSDSQSGAAAQTPHRSPLIWIGAAAAILAIVTLGALLMRSRKTPAAVTPAASIHDLKIQTLTSNGNVSRAAMSRDGRYVAHAVEDSQGRTSLRVRQVATGSEVEVAPALETRFVGVAFSPDGNYVYYARRDESGGTMGWLYQVPSLGGTARKIIFDVDTAPGFSPDGKQLAFGRGVPTKNEHHYIVTKPDGTEPRVVAVLPRYGLNFLTTPAWSADGTKLYAANLLPPGGAIAKPMEIDLATGQQRMIGSANYWWINSVVPAPDGRSLYLAAVHRETGLQQIWSQPLPDGPPRRITNDFNNYTALSVTADGRTLAATAADTDGRIDVSAVSDTGPGTRIETERAPHVANLVTSASGLLVYARRENAMSNIAALDSLTSQPRLLTNNNYSDEPSVSADGTVIVYTSLSNENLHIWAIDPDGTNQRQVTDGPGEFSPLISPDGRTLLYLSEDKLWKRPLAGGTAVRIADRATGAAGFSPDSQTIFYGYWNADQPTLSVRAESLRDGSVLFDKPWVSGRDPRGHPDNSGFTVVRSAGGADNLFLQKWDGSEPVQLTRFREGEIESYGWLPDGRLVLIRTETRSDVVLITGFE